MHYFIDKKIEAQYLTHKNLIRLVSGYLEANIIIIIITNFLSKDFTCLVTLWGWSTLISILQMRRVKSLPCL